MKYFEDPGLSMLTSTLSSLQVGDRILEGKLEAFTFKRGGADKKLSKTLEQQYLDEVATSPSSILSSSPLGSLADSSTRKLLINLISTMNAAFPDYDFSSLRPEQFAKESSLSVVMNAVNSHLAEIVEEHPEFLEQLWEGVNNVINMRECEVYAYIPDMDSDPFTDGNLWSFNFFFVNKTMKRLVYFACIARSIFAKDDEDDDDMYYDNDNKADDTFQEDDQFMDWEEDEV